MSELRPTARVAIFRGFRRRCPACGCGRLFDAWYTTRDQCDACALDFQAHDGQTWAFMYLSTAGLTGLFVAVMLLVRPEDLFAGRLVLFVAAVLAIVASLPIRKGMAIAVEYLVSRSWDADDTPDS